METLFSATSNRQPLQPAVNNTGSNLIHTLFREIDDLKRQTEDLKRATKNSKPALKQTMQHFSPEKRDRTEVGVEVRAAEEIIPEDNSTPEREVETEIQIQTKTNHLEMSPPLGRYEQSQFEKTFNHKLDNMSVKELNGMKESTLAKIKEIEEKFLDEKAHENSL